MKIVLRDWDLRDVGSILVFGDDSELRRILRLMSGSVPISLRSFCNVWFSMGVRGSEFGIRKVPFCRFMDFQILAFDLRRGRNSKHFRLEKNPDSEFGKLPRLQSKLGAPGCRFVR